MISAVSIFPTEFHVTSLMNNALCGFISITKIEIKFHSFSDKFQVPRKYSSRQIGILKRTILYELFLLSLYTVLFSLSNIFVFVSSCDAYNKLMIYQYHPHFVNEDHKASRGLSLFSFFFIEHSNLFLH